MLSSRAAAVAAAATWRELFRSAIEQNNFSASSRTMKYDAASFRGERVSAARPPSRRLSLSLGARVQRAILTFVADSQINSNTTRRGGGGAAKRARRRPPLRARAARVSAQRLATKWPSNDLLCRAIDQTRAAIPIGASLISQYDSNELLISRRLIAAQHAAAAADTSFAARAEADAPKRSAAGDG